MMLLRHYCSIKRQTAIGTNGRKQLSTLASNVRCLILPMSPQTAVENQFTPTKAHDAYFDAGTDVKTGDKLIWGTQSFLVRGTQVYDVPTVGHIRALCEREAS